MSLIDTNQVSANDYIQIQLIVYLLISKSDRFKCLACEKDLVVYKDLITNKCYEFTNVDDLIAQFLDIYTESKDSMKNFGIPTFITESKHAEIK